MTPAQYNDIKLTYSVLHRTMTILESRGHICRPSADEDSYTLGFLMKKSEILPMSGKPFKYFHMWVYFFDARKQLRMNLFDRRFYIPSSLMDSTGKIIVPYKNVYELFDYTEIESEIKELVNRLAEYFNLPRINNLHEQKSLPD